MTRILKISFSVLIVFLFFSSNSFAAGSPAVSGTFRGNGKSGTLSYATAYKGDPFGGKETTMVALTEKDPGTDKRPDHQAVFGKLGNALIITIDQEGDIIGCEVYHEALSAKPFSSIGRVKLKDLVNDSTSVKGKLTTGGEVKTFDDKWEVDLTFNAKKK